MLVVAKYIADDIINVMRAVMASDTGINKKVGKNTLVDSEVYKTLNSAVQEAGDNIILSLFVNNYITFIESGRRKGAKRPPFRAIEEWCLRKGITDRNDVIWAIINAISRDGISPRPIISVFFEHIDRKFDEEYYDLIFNEIIKRLDEYFNQ